MNFETGRVDYKDSAMGRMEQTVKEQAENQLAELKKLRQDFDNYVDKQESEGKATAERQRVERKINLVTSAVVGSISGIIAGIFVYYWPSIVFAVGYFFHK